MGPLVSSLRFSSWQCEIPWHYLGDDDIVIGLVRYDAKRRYSQVTGPEGERIPSVVVFWFAWQAFYPETELWKP
jgi:hypothetical protein